MQRDEETPSWRVGADGKFGKQPERKTPATSYDCPASRGSETGKRLWLSKLMDPACRLISGGATRIFPSLFSKLASAAELPALSSEDHDGSHTEVEQDANVDDHSSILNQGMSRSTGVPGPSRETDRLNIVFHRLNIVSDDKKGGVPEENGFSEVKQLMKGKKFSRDEINRLIEIVHSRAATCPNVEKGKKNRNVTARGEVEGPIVALEIPRKSIEEKMEDTNRAIWGASIQFLFTSLL